MCFTERHSYCYKVKFKNKRLYPLHICVHCSFVLNSQGSEVTQVPLVDKWMARCSPYNGILVSLKKEGKTHTYYNVNEP